MKYILVFTLAILSMTACKDATPSEKVSVQEQTQSIANYPADLIKVFDHHGSLSRWKAMKAMSYEIVKEGQNEKQMIDLHSRVERIEASDFTSGFDGNKYWVIADSTYKGNPKFYTNLIFYFYAMPFVLADEGIIYSKIDPIVFEGKSYPGYRISYGDGVGVSPEDEYFIHYDSETYEMQWLGYTVTFFSNEKSDKRSYINYNDWKEFNGIKLPNSMAWYGYNEGKITEFKKTRAFTNVKLSGKAWPAGTFDMPDGAMEVE